MNAEKLFKLAMAVFLTATIIGCIDSNNNDNSNRPLDENHIPTIIRVRLAVNGYIVDPYEAYVGNQLIAVANFLDGDTDLTTLYINYYHESDDFTTPMSTQVALIPPTNLTEFGYAFFDDIYTVVAPTGYWKVRFYAVDEAGNESNEIELDFLVRE